MQKETRRKSGILLIFIIVLSLALAAVLIAKLYLDYSDAEEAKREPIYEYVSVSGEAAARAYVWLSRIEDMPLTYEEIKEMMGEISLEVVLTPSDEEGRYMRSLGADTAANCEALAQAGLERAYREVVRYRLKGAGVEGEISDEMLDERMRGAYGISVAEYLAHCNVQLLPGAEELRKTYSGEVTHE